MINRKILYGYQIRNGEIAVHITEAEIVKRVFTLYCAGESYQKIADTLNGDKIPFCEEAPLWNKHKVKRLLENPRYTGDSGYPAVIDENLFLAAKEKNAEKAENRQIKNKKEHDCIWRHTVCAECGGRLLRIGGGRIPAGYQYLKCKDCGVSTRIPESELVEGISRQIHDHQNKLLMPKPYAPSEEVMRLTNAINRGIEQPTTPEDVVSLILQGVSARYDCCPAATEYENDDRRTEVDWKRFGQAVSHITISTENTVTVYFK